jgi:XTP/dITP diphosphohydrolase
VPDGLELTTAQLPPEEKDTISHRGRAFRALAPAIAELLA